MKREFKCCEDCGKTMGDADLFWRKGHLLCADDYQIRFGPGAS